MMVGTARRPLNTLSLSQPQKSACRDGGDFKGEVCPAGLLDVESGVGQKVGAQSSGAP